MSKFFVAFFVLSVAGLYMFNSVNAECKPGPDCTDCWCHKEQGYGCCEGFDCDSNNFSAGTCHRTKCKGPPNCYDCWCDSSHPCCEGYGCIGVGVGLGLVSGVCRTIETLKYF